MEHALSMRRVQFSHVEHCFMGKNRKCMMLTYLNMFSVCYRQKGKSEMLTYLNMFTALQAKGEECDAHIFEHVHCVAGKTQRV